MARTSRCFFPPIVAFGAVVSFSFAAHAEWIVDKALLGPGYVVRHDSGSTGLVVSTRFRTKRGARAAAKALNKAEDTSEGGDHETGSDSK